MLTPAQERTLAQLRRDGEPLVFSEAFVNDLKTEATEALEQFHTRLGNNTLFVNKHKLATVHGCEGKFMAPDPFAWTIANARGTVTHKAIQLLINWKGEPAPRELVDEALALLADEPNDFGRWLDALGRADEAELRGNAVEHLTKFMESFPPQALEAKHRPVPEASTRWPNEGPIVFNSKVDLVTGAARGRESNKLIIDFKTGWVSHQHRDDLRFYALIETLVRDVPPRKLATLYLDSAEPIVEDVTEEVLVAALRRTLDGVHAMIELNVEGRAPVLRPGPHCRWCPISTECPQSEADKSHDYD